MKLTPSRALLLGGFTDLSGLENGLKLNMLLDSVLFPLLSVPRRKLELLYPSCMVISM